MPAMSIGQMPDKKSKIAGKNRKIGYILSVKMAPRIPKYLAIEKLIRVKIFNGNRFEY